MSNAPDSNPDASWFVRDRFGLFIHWGTYSLAARHEWVKQRERIPDAVYRKYFERFSPDLYDPAEWAEQARRAGMKYAVITAKHHEGFCLWDTRHTDCKATNTPWGRDLLRPFVEAFRSAGLRVGFYYSLLDWRHPEYPVDRRHPMAEDKTFREANRHRDVSKYAQYMRDQVRELLSDYGKIDIMWYDFSFPGEDGKGREDWESEKLLSLTRELQPGILVNNRLDLPEGGDFETPEQFQPRSAPRDAKGRPLVWEACQTFSGSWGYHRDEQTWKSVRQLLWMLIDGASKGGNLLLNVGPTARGLFDERARDRLAGIGRWMRLHGRSIYGCGPAPDELEAPPDCRYTYNPATGRLYLHVFNWPFRTIALPGLHGRVAYAQLLNDASEVPVLEPGGKVGSHHWGFPGQDSSETLQIPVAPPDVEVPVVELFPKRSFEAPEA